MYRILKESILCPSCVVWCLDMFHSPLTVQSCPRHYMIKFYILHDTFSFHVFWLHGIYMKRWSTILSHGLSVNIWIPSHAQIVQNITMYARSTCIQCCRFYSMFSEEIFFFLFWSTFSFSQFLFFLFHFKFMFLKPYFVSWLCSCEYYSLAFCMFNFFFV